MLNEKQLNTIKRIKKIMRENKSYIILGRGVGICKQTTLVDVTNVNGTKDRLMFEVTQMFKVLAEGIAEKEGTKKSEREEKTAIILCGFGVSMALTQIALAEAQGNTTLAETMTKAMKMTLKSVVGKN